MIIKSALMEKISKLIFEKRTEQGLEQKDISYNCKISKAMLSRVERNLRNLSLEKCIVICKYLDCYEDMLIIIKQEGDKN